MFWQLYVVRRTWSNSFLGIIIIKILRNYIFSYNFFGLLNYYYLDIFIFLENNIIFSVKLCHGVAYLCKLWINFSKFGPNSNYFILFSGLQIFIMSIYHSNICLTAFDTNYIIFRNVEKDSKKYSFSFTEQN
jgi:hypothetical protein